MLQKIHYKKFPFTDFKEITMFREAFHEFLSRIKHIPSQPPISVFNMDFRIDFTSVRGSIISTITRICAGRSGVQIMDGARELCLLQNVEASSRAHPASNTTKTRAISAAVTWPGQTV